MDLRKFSFKGTIDDLYAIELEQIKKNSIEFIIISHVIRQPGFSTCTLHRSDSLGDIIFLRMYEPVTFLIPFCQLEKMFKIDTRGGLILVESCYISPPIIHENHESNQFKTELIVPDLLYVSSGSTTDNTKLYASGGETPLKSEDLIYKGDLIELGLIHTILYKYSILSNGSKASIKEFDYGERFGHKDKTTAVILKRLFGRSLIKIGYVVILSFQPRSLQRFLDHEMDSFMNLMFRSKNSGDHIEYCKNKLDDLRKISSPHVRNLISIMGPSSYHFLFVCTYLSYYLVDSESTISNMETLSGMGSKSITSSFIESFNSEIPCERYYKSLVNSNANVPIDVAALLPEA